MKKVPVLSVKKALDMLGILAFEDVDCRGFGLSELAKKMNMAPNTAHNLLKTMMVCGFVAQNDDRKYITGPQCEQLGRVFRRKALADLALPLLRTLGARLGEVVMLAVLQNGQRRIVAQVDPQRSIRADPGIDSTVSLYGFVTGRLLLAYASDEEWRRSIERQGLPGALWEGIDTEQKLRATTDSIRRRGACVMEKKGEGLVAFAVPVLTRQGVLVGALGCYAPAFRCPKKKGQQVLAVMRGAAGDLAGLLEARS
jgi:IclR family acetate operon transcriptional repressor